MEETKSKVRSGFTVAETAQRLGVTRNAIYSWVRRTSGLPIKRIGRRIFVDEGALTNFHARAAKHQPYKRIGLASHARIPAGNEPQIIEIGRDETQSSSEGHPIKPDAVTAQMPEQKMSCGQRELQLPQARWLGNGFIVFKALQTMK